MFDLSSIEERLWNEYEAALFLGISIHTIRKWRTLKVIPYVKLNNGSVRFNKAALMAWVNERTVDAAPEEASRIVFLRQPGPPNPAAPMADHERVKVM